MRDSSDPNPAIAAAPSATPLYVVVAMLTFRRPDCLDRALPLLAEQAGELSPPATIVIVDNDPAGGARGQVEQWAAQRVRYVHEPRPGIAAARNRALTEGYSLDADALVFIDDDELPSKQWLSSVVDAWARWKCAAVAGPVVAHFEQQVDPWIMASQAFDRRMHATGDTVSGAATHNLLLDLQSVRQLDLRFDERLGLTGGEDTMFSHQLIDRGGVIRWCDEAEVIEPVPSVRLTRRWVLRRAYRAGTSWSRMELALARTPRRTLERRLVLAARGVVKLTGGAGLWLAGLATRNVARQARGAGRAASYAGLLAGAFGLSLREYRR